MPQGPPISVTTDSNECTSVSVSWSPPDVTLQNGVITSYKLFYTTDNSLPWDMRTSTIVRAANCSLPQSTRITNLRTPSSLYYISVSAGTSAGFGPYANISGYPSSRRESLLDQMPPSFQFKLEAKVMVVNTCFPCSTRHSCNSCCYQCWRCGYSNS